MKIILVKDFPGIGNLGTEKDVKDGYARNFLIPNKIALPVNHPEAQKILLNKRSDAKKELSEKSKKDEELSKLLKQKFVFKVKVNKKGESYKAITTKEIADVLKINPKKIKLQPIKKVGENKVKIELDGKEEVISVVLEEIK